MLGIAIGLGVMFLCLVGMVKFLDEDTRNDENNGN